MQIAVAWKQHSWLLQHDAKSRLIALSLVMVEMKKENMYGNAIENEEP